jgi:hypothetical protein
MKTIRNYILKQLASTRLAVAKFKYLGMKTTNKITQTKNLEQFKFLERLLSVQKLWSSLFHPEYVNV